MSFSFFCCSSLIFLPTNIQKMDVWNLVWLVVCADMIIKFVIVSIKAFVTLLPLNVFPLRKRGNVYSVIENIGLFYRSFPPIRPWLFFLTYSETSLLEKLLNSSDQLKVTNDTIANLGHSTTSQAFPILLCVLYFIFKVNQMFNCLTQLTHAVKEMFNESVSDRFTSFKQQF